ncbi:TRAP transporter large permease subunit, partial [Paracoccus sp. (in: a-proteobacteria)]|uniref:TRAP transporter large permease subunit n=1 Tax=Paracoccus sp. TaxID=267 RepID=UPI0035B42532
MAVIALAFVGLLALGVPVVFVLGASAVLALVTTTEVPVAIVSQRVFAGLNSFTLMAIPFFVFAGVIMDAGGISRRIVAFASALIGWIVGSLYQVSCVAAAGLAAISGSGSADTAAISAIMQPQLRRRGYDVDFGAALIACA